MNWWVCNVMFRYLLVVYVNVYGKIVVYVVVCEFVFWVRRFLYYLISHNEVSSPQIIHCTIKTTTNISTNINAFHQNKQHIHLSTPPSDPHQYQTLYQFPELN